MIHHSLPGHRGLTVLQEAVHQNAYQNNSCQRNGKRHPFQMSIKRESSCRNGNRDDVDESHFTVTENCYIHEQNIPPAPPPLLPKRTTSLLGTANRNLSMRASVSLNPTTAPVGHFVNGWEIGRDRNLETMSSVWTEKDECVNIWGDLPAKHKGIIILQQRDKLWPRWKERYCILTKDYLHCFRRTTSVHRSGVRLSEMGTFIFKIRLADIETVEWDMRKSGPIIEVILPQDSRICLRTPSDTYEALNQWYTLLSECVYLSKERRQALRNLHNGSTLTMDTLQSHRSTLSNRTCPSETQQSQLPASSSRISTGGKSHHNLSDGSSNSSTKSKSTNTSQSCNKGNSSSTSDGNSNLSSHSSSSNNSSKENCHQKLVEENGTMQTGRPSNSHHHQHSQQPQSKLHSNSHSQNTSSMSFRKNIGRVSLSKLTQSNSKVTNVQQRPHYAPPLTYVSDESDEDYDETQDQLLEERFPYAIANQKASRASIAVDNPNSFMMSRHGIPSMTLNDFVRNPWRNKTAVSGISGIASCSKGSAIDMSTGYSVPKDSLPVTTRSSSHSRQRSDESSWDPQTTYYRQSLMSKMSPSTGIGGGNFSRGDSIYSRHTSDITFRKLS